MSYGVSFLRYGCNTQFSVIMGHFFALLPNYWPQKLKTEKKKEIFPFSHVHNKDS